MTDRHPDLLTTEEAEAYVRLGKGGIKTLRTRWGLRPSPLGKGLYHRADLDAIVRMAHTGEQPKRRLSMRSA